MKSNPILKISEINHRPFLGMTPNDKNIYSIHPKKVINTDIVIYLNYHSKHTLF